MINDLQEVQWAYLLDPAFELVNTAGKPLTDGYIEVYIHGTRNKYYCASDFDGTLHPFKIPLDALGANIVLASSAHSYDIYVYNKFGSLVMSRYNIQPKTGSGEIVHDDITVSSDDGSVHIVTSGQTNYDLSIQDTIDRVDIVESSITNLATSIEEISNVVTGHDVDIEELKANKKDKQEEYVAIGGPTKTITKVEQDEDGKMSVIYEDIDLPQEVPNVEITSPNGTINIASSIDIATNTKTFEIDVDGHEPDWHYWTANNSWTTLTDGAWKDINRPTMGAGKAPHSWTPEVKLGVYDAKADFTVTFHNQDNSYTVPNQIIQIGFRAKLVGKNNADAISYVDLGAWTYDPSLYTTESYQYNFAQESLRQNYSTSKILYVPNYVGDTEFYIYYQAALLNTDGSQHVTAIDPVCRAEITYFGYHEVVGSITGTASDGTTLYAGSGIDIDDDDRINVNIGEGLTIINNSVSIDKSVVLAKDNLVAGDNITITASGDNLIISSDADVSELATKDELASAVDELQDQIDNIPAPITYTGASGVTVDDDTISLDDPIGVLAGDGIVFTASGDDIIISANVDTSSFATKTELGSAIDELQSEINNIPAQVQSDWTEEDVDDPAYIQHKPVDKALVAGENITITDIGSAIEISSVGGGASGATYTAGDGIDITNDVISVDNTIARSSDLASTLEAYIPYSASGVELPNSHFEIGVDGQAYKTHDTIDTTEYAITPAASGGYVTGPITVSNGASLVISGCKPYAIIGPNNIPAHQANSEGVATFNATETFTVDTFTIWQFDTTKEQEASITNGTLTITQSGAIKERYVLESELASAIPDVSNFVTNSDLASAINVIEAEIPDTSNLATKTALSSAIDELQSEINNIPAQVQADWNEDDIADPSYIQNKPSIPTKTSDLQNDSGFATTTDLEAYIPYAASGVVLPNSNFEIGVDGQAYKTEVDSGSIEPEFDSGSVMFINDNKLQPNTTYTLTVPTEVRTYAIGDGTSMFMSGLVTDGVFSFTWTGAETSAILSCYYSWLSYIAVLNASNTTLTYVNASKERYILESELASAIPEVATYVAGEGITFTASGDDVIISSNVDTSSFATKTELGSAIDELQSEINDIPTPTTYTGASGVNVDNDFISLDDPIGVIAGEGITFTASGDDVIISSSSSGASYTAGIGITIDNAVLNVDTSVIAPISAIPDFNDLNTAGITDIQIVNALPASPVATVLYLVRE